MALLNSDGNLMQYNNLGGTGLMVSEISFGTMTFSDNNNAATGTKKGDFGESAYNMMEAAYKGGINFYDCAEVYGGGGSSERVLGDAIKIGEERGTWERMDLVISTKIYGGGRGQRDTINSIGLSRKHLYEGLRQSLERMQLEYVDLVFCHRPDPRTPVEEVVRGMNFLIDKGMAFYWGTSEWSAQMIQEAKTVALSLGLCPPYFDQAQYSMIARERVEVEYKPLYPELGLTIWSPLGGGTLTGKYGTDPAKWSAELGRAAASANPAAVAALKQKAEIAEALRPFASRLGCTIPQLALSWCLRNPNVSTAIIGATSQAQLKDNFGALAVKAKLTPELMAELDAKILKNVPPPIQSSPNPKFRTTASKL